MRSRSRTPHVVGTVLAAGVYSSVLLMLVGAGIAAVSPGSTPLPRAFGEILRLAATGQGLALMQVGVALLIATPVLRVVASVAAFASERDWTYVAITVAVLALLAVSVLLPTLLGQAH